MSDLIKREDAIKVVHEYFIEALYKEPTKIDEDGDEVFTDMKSVNKLLTHNKTISKALKALPSAEPQGELINKDDAIKAVANYIWHLPNECYKNFNSYNDIEEVVTDAVKQLPSTNDNWIPVSERLPKQTDEYIVSVHYSRDCVWTDKLGYTPTTDGGWYDPEETKQNMVDWNKYVIAWMPLPTPYKGGDEK